MELKNVEIIEIGELRTFPNSEFYLVEWVVKDDSGQYPQFLKLQSNKEKADNVIKYNKVGDRVNVAINLQGRQWTNPEGKTVVFNTIEAWKVFKADLSDDNLKKASEVIDTHFEPLDVVKTSEEDDLPF